MPAANALVAAAAGIIRRLVDDPNDAVARQDGEEFCRLFKQWEADVLHAVFTAGPNTPGFFGPKATP